MDHILILEIDNQRPNGLVNAVVSIGRRNTQIEPDLH